MNLFSCVVMQLEMGKQGFEMGAQVCTATFYNEIVSSLAEISIFTDKSALHSPR